MATLTLGLPDNSRVKMKFSGQKLSYEHSVLALILDAINNWIWMNQKKGTPRPKSMYKMLTAEKPEREELQTFDSTDEFDAWLESKRNKDV